MKDGRGGKWASAALIEGYATHSDNMPHKKYVKWQRRSFNGNNEKQK